MTRAELIQAVQDFRPEWTLADAIDAELPARAYYEYCRQSKTIRELHGKLQKHSTSDLMREMCRVARALSSEPVTPGSADSDSQFALFTRIDRVTRFVGLWFSPLDFPKKPWSKVPKKRRGQYVQKFNGVANALLIGLDCRPQRVVWRPILRTVANTSPRSYPR